MNRSVNVVICREITPELAGVHRAIRCECTRECDELL